jgi:hypothetical protein
MNTMVRGRLAPGRAPVWALGAVVYLVLLAGAVACGGGGDGEATSSPGATVAPTATPSAVEQQLTGMVLQPSDLPDGFSVVQEGFSTNEEVAGQGEDAAELLAQLTEWGRILSRGVVFESSAETGVLLVDSTVSLYEADSGAIASFADAVDTARATDWQTSAGSATNVAVQEVPPLDAADEMLWLRITGTAQVGDPPTETPFIQDVILMRVGRARGSVSIISSAVDAAPLVESMVRAQAANMAAGLQ